MIDECPFCGRGGYKSAASLASHRSRCAARNGAPGAVSAPAAAPGGDGAARPKKQRRRRGELERCFACPPDHHGWPRALLKNRRKLPYCPEHREERDSARAATLPDCPKCGDGDFGALMDWAGDVPRTTVRCEACGFEGRAIEYFTTSLVELIARPIDYEATSYA